MTSSWSLGNGNEFDVRGRYFGCSFSAAELIQYSRPVGPGPSGKTWPRWPLHFEHRTSVRIMPWLTSRSSSTWLSTAGAVKLGQPQPESNLASESNSVWPQPAQVYVPWRCSCSYSPENGRSVAFSRSTAYCIGVNSRRHSASLFSTFAVLVSVIGFPLFVIQGCAPWAQARNPQPHSWLWTSGSLA